MLFFHVLAMLANLGADWKVRSPLLCLPTFGPEWKVEHTCSQFGKGHTINRGRRAGECRQAGRTLGSCGQAPRPSLANLCAGRVDALPRLVRW